MTASMSKFAERQKSREEEQTKSSERRTLLGKYLYNISLACFTVMVLGALTEWQDDPKRIYTAILGTLATVLSACAANRILKG